MTTVNQIGLGLSGASGSGNFAGTISATLVTPALGTPSSGVLSGCTGYAQSALTGLATGISTWLGTPSSANLLSAMTTKTGTGSLVFGTSPSLTTPSINQITDTSANPILTLTPIASSVNYFTMANAASGGAPTLGITGSSTDVNMYLQPKGVGGVILNTAATNTPLVMYSGTSNQKQTSFHFANTAGSNTVTFPDSSGTVMYTGTAITQIKTFVFTSNATYTPSTGMQYVLIEMCGAGGGGGGSQSGTVGSSGAAGGYIKQLLTASEVGASLALVIPAGGSGGGTNTGGNTGGNTTVSTPSNVIVLTANGGSGGLGGVSGVSGLTGGTFGGTASVSTGSVTYTGLYIKGGGSSASFTITNICLNSLPGVNPLSTTSAGQGGGSGGFVATTGNGYGAGGGCAVSDATGGNRSGVAGTSGVVFITEYISA